MPKPNEIRMDDLAPRKAPDRPGALPHYTGREKVLPLGEAIARFVRPGDSVALGTCLEQMIPFAATREIMRQNIGDLSLIGPVSDICFDQLIGAGLARRVMAAWVGNVMMGSAIVGKNPLLKPVKDPLGGDAPILAVRSLSPDVAIVHVQRADPHGNAILWGSLGITSDAVRAARAVIVTAEEVVAPEQIRRDPNRVVIPGIVVSAVCEARWGAHPSPVQGYYRRDHEAYREYHEVTKTKDGYERWRREWVEGARDLPAYVRKLGNERVAALIPLEHALPEPVDYGY